MNDLRPASSCFLALLGVSLDQVNTFLSCAAYAVAIIAGLPACLRVIRSWFPKSTK